MKALLIPTIMLFVGFIWWFVFSSVQHDDTDELYNCGECGRLFPSKDLTPIESGRVLCNNCLKSL